MATYNRCRIFFVISGFLITSLLLKEEDRNGRVSLKLFYERRAARILPVYWSYILAVLTYSIICAAWFRSALFSKH